MSTALLIIALVIPLSAGLAWWLRGWLAKDPLKQTVDEDHRPDKTVFLRKIDKMILAGAPLDDIAYQAVNLVPISENIVGAVLRTVDEHRNLTVRAVSDVLIVGSPAFKKLLSDTIAPTDNQRNQSLMLQAINTRQVVTGRSVAEFVVPPLTVPEAQEVERVLGVACVAAYPIIVDDIVAGVFTFYLRQAQPTSHDTALMQAIRDEVGIALKNMHLLDRLEGINRKLEDTNLDLQQANATKDEFISIASHQLRSPLTAVKGHLSMLLEGDYGKIPKPQQAVVSRMTQSTNEVINLINDMLSISRINAKKFELNYTPVRYEDVVSDVVAELAPLAELKTLKVNLRLPPRHLGVVYLDPLRIRQVMVNFLDNAIKYTPKGHVEVEVSLVDDVVRYAVTDTGIGIPEADQKELFGKFYRAANARELAATGSGLGLYVAKQIVEQHGGQVFVKSTLGQGSTFGFDIPLEVLQHGPRNAAKVAVTV